MASAASTPDTDADSEKDVDEDTDSAAEFPEAFMFALIKRSLKIPSDITYAKHCDELRRRALTAAYEDRGSNLSSNRSTTSEERNARAASHNGAKEVADSSECACSSTSLVITNTENNDSCGMSATG